MTLDIKAHLTELIQAALKSVAPTEAGMAIVLERPKQESHGDFAAALAMQLARSLKKNPREIAQQLVNELPASPWVEKVDIAGAGFINFTVKASAKTAVVQAVLAQGGNYGKAASNGRKVQVEYVSANPTGPLHVGHGRGAAYGASLSSLLAYAGWDVTQEYYVNDAG
ncbi:MAG: arginine--tRNA ligase, partial [Betaproteobacteria bacterium]|nr:arginine--tRNA ligase [Betaproteobacteria bacterium]